MASLLLQLTILMYHTLFIWSFLICLKHLKISKKMALVIGHSRIKVMHHYIQDSSILTLSYPGSGVDQPWSKLEDIAIIIIILSPGCQQPFLVKMASDNRLSAAVFGLKWLVTTSCQQPLPKTKQEKFCRHIVKKKKIEIDRRTG